MQRSRDSRRGRVEASQGAWGEGWGVVVAGAARTYMSRHVFPQAPSPTITSFRRISAMVSRGMGRRWVVGNCGQRGEYLDGGLAVIEVGQQAASGCYGGEGTMTATGVVLQRLRLSCDLRHAHGAVITG